ncbi:MAG: hypothetical protein OQJ96_06575 [Flavobacteriales bacterium]|nr:hypothetical protein [Flavobacteriales bacterium]MCW8913747.1 hypothetical protein [Flavobacteriales bacterium]MCW8938471.1 hypothetical protein [Flavobacteriales bacterium]MCW8967764.1 hypothetical protein [Flavobacteriales bacterium]MCW8989953.1 hypothetical protein [Flavobacteriales bacterium]
MKKALILLLSSTLLGCSVEFDETQCYDIKQIHYCNTMENIVNPETLNGTFMEFRLNNANEVGGIQVYSTPQHDNMHGFNEFFRIDEISIEENGAIVGYSYLNALRNDNSEKKQLYYIVYINTDGTVGISTLKDYPNPSCYLVYKIKTPLQIDIDPNYPKISFIKNNSSLDKVKTSKKKTFEEQMEKYKKDNYWGE